MFIKKVAVANRVFAEYDALREAIDATLGKLGATYRDRMTALLTLVSENLEKASNSAA